MPRKVFVAGEILTAADVNTNLMDQAVMVFDDAAARTTAIPSPVEGMVTYLKSDDSVTKFNGSAFVPVGTILQVVSTAKTDTFTSTSATFTTVTGLSASITPSSTSSKVIAIVQLSHGLNNNAGFGHFRLAGGNAASYVGNSSGSRISAVFGGFSFPNNVNKLESGSIVFLDSPNTTSSTTYSVECRLASTGGIFVNRSASDTDSDVHTRGASTITLMEVAG